jgi:hypothetical protein
MGESKYMWKNVSSAMDFDDLLLKTKWIVDPFPGSVKKKPFSLYLVDEYQDTNHSQYLIVRALSDKFQNICVVGDDAKYLRFSRWISQHTTRRTIEVRRTKQQQHWQLLSR